MELVCPAGTLQSLKTAVDSGADSVYSGLKGGTNARNFPALNLTPEELKEGVGYARSRGVKTYAAINAFMKDSTAAAFDDALNAACRAEVDAVIIADIGVLQMIKDNFKDSNLRVHLSVQASACNSSSLNFLADKFNIKRAVLPRVLGINDIEDIIKNTKVEIEVFGFGSLCLMCEGKCYLSQYLAGEGSNLEGVCSPADKVEYVANDGYMDFYLNKHLINRFKKGESLSYPTACKGLYKVEGKTVNPFSKPASLQALDLFETFKKIGVTAIKIEGRQRSKAYTSSAIRLARRAIIGDVDLKEFEEFCEGGRITKGAYDKSWL